MEHYLIHENELSGHPALAALVQEIDRLHPPVGYERLLYPHFFIVPEQKSYARVILDSENKLVIPILPMEESVYRRLAEFCRESDLEILLVDKYHEWLDRDGLRLVPLGALQNIDLPGFVLSGTRMRKLRYMVNRFEKSGLARTEEYNGAADLPLAQMVEVMEKWGKSKNNVIWHTALCMEHLLKGELPPGHRAFFTYLNDQLCSIIMIEAFGEGGYLMDQEFYDPETAPLGHMEYAIVQMIDRLKAEKIEVLSLGATWYPFPFANHPKVDAEGWAWVVKSNDRKTLLSRIFEQGQSNYQFKKKFGEEGEPIFAYLPPTASFSMLLQYWSVFYQNSLTPPQLSERLRKHLLSSSGKMSSMERPEDRQELWDRAEKIEDIPYSAHPLDLMTDTWFGKQSRAVLDFTEVLRLRTVPESTDLLRELFPFKHLVLTRQGRDAEALFYANFGKEKKKILGAIPWTSTLLNQLEHGFEIIELPCRHALEPESDYLFKGEIDLVALKGRLAVEADQVALVGLEVLNNATGGHPVRLSHIRELAALLKQFEIPLVLDASRIVRNAVLLKQYDPACRDMDVWSIVRSTMAEADHVVTSLTKDFAVPVGGLIGTNDDLLAIRIRTVLANRNASAGNEAILIHQSLADKASIIRMMEEQMALTRSLQERLVDCGIPIRKPAYGHAIVIELSRYAADPTSKVSKEKILRDLFIEAGIRGGIHQVGKQRQTVLDQCIRLAFPLGISRSSEDTLFEKLKSFFEKRSLKVAEKHLIETRIDDFSPYLSESERQQIKQENHPKKPFETAIIGLSGKFPQSDNHYEFWEKIDAGANFVGHVPNDRWRHSDYHDAALPKTFIPHKTRCQFGSFLKSHDSFDASFFKLSPEEVVMLDPQERLAMEAVWSCIEDAGYIPDQLGREVGIFSGVTYNEYQKIVPKTTHSCFVTSRLAYFFNFHGPAFAVDTGCASSISAIDAACKSLANEACRTAIVTGSNVILHPDHYASLSPELSTTDQPESRPFGNSDGWIPAEGVVSILLKPMTEAVQDGDHIYGVIKSSLIGHEGKTSWFSAFNPKRQAGLIEANFEKAGIHPTTISYVEAAANGSPLGDAIELEGLTIAFGKFSKKKEFCPIGTVKSNVGHGEGVSTMLQLAKVLLQFKSKRIYPLIHLNGHNPNIRIEETPFRFPVSTEEWRQPSFRLHDKEFLIPRRATISSFGGGGNMGHLILEEAPLRREELEALPAYFIPLSSGTNVQLLRIVADFLSFFKRMESFDPNWKRTYHLLNVMRTLCEGRVTFSQRVVFVATDLKTLKTQFNRFLKSEPDPNIIIGQKGQIEKKEVVRLPETKAWHELGLEWVNGAEISWEKFFVGAKGNRVPLPTYCFEKRRFEISEKAFLEACRSSAEKSSVSSLGLSKPNGSQDLNLTRVVKNAFSKALSLAIDEIDLFKPLDQYGFDSAMVIGVATELEKYFKRVPQTLFFECTTVHEVIQYLQELYPGEVREQFEARHASAKAEEEPSNSDSSLDEMTEAILSDRFTADQVLAQLK